MPKERAIKRTFDAVVGAQRGLAPKTSDCFDGKLHQASNCRGGDLDSSCMVTGYCNDQISITGVSDEWNMLLTQRRRLLPQDGLENPHQRL